MNHDFSNVFIANMLAKQAMHEALYGKPKAKKTSLLKRLMKKIS